MQLIVVYSIVCREIMLVHFFKDFFQKTTLQVVDINIHKKISNFVLFYYLITPPQVVR